MSKQAVVPTIGADPECFLVDPDGTIVPAIGFINGTKENPYRPEGAPKGYGLQVDNVMLEYNIPPATTPHDFTSNISYAEKLLRSALPKGYGITYTPTHSFTPKQLSDPAAQEIGCAIDYDAYEGGQPRTALPALSNLRTCGGHIHLGGDFNCPQFVAALFCDAVLGIGLHLCNMEAKVANERRAWYGAPGIYRPTPYGIEYRTPSNVWLYAGYSDKIATYALRLARWLSETPPAEIRSTFKQIDWALVRAAMTDKNPNARVIQPAYSSIHRSGINFV